MAKVVDAHNQFPEGIDRPKQERSYQLITLLFIASIVVLFGGFISAIVVSSLDNFWVNFPLPTAFYWSTGVILASSVTIFLAKIFALKNNQGMIRNMMLLTILLSLLFGFFQFRGFKQLIDKNFYVSGQGIFYHQGAFGDHFVVTKNGKNLYFDGVDYLYEGEKLGADEIATIQNFLEPIRGADRKYIQKKYDLQNYGNVYGIAYRADEEDMNYAPLDLNDGVFTIGGSQLTNDAKSQLFYFSFGVCNGTPFFGIKGVYGEDFTLSLNGSELEFADRKLFFPSHTLDDAAIKEIEASFFQAGKEFTVKDGKVYSEGKEQNLSSFEAYFPYGKSNDQLWIENGVWIKMGAELTHGQYNRFYGANNVASSYIWVITIMHLLHVVLGVVLLIVLFVRTQKGYYNSGNIAGLRIGGMFWHFLGILWLFLFIFWKVYAI